MELSVEFEQTEGDVVAQIRASLRRTALRPPMRKFLLGPALIAWTMLALAMVPTYTLIENWTPLRGTGGPAALTALVVLAEFLLARAIIASSVRMMVRSQAAVSMRLIDRSPTAGDLGRRKVILGPDGCRVEAAGSVCMHEWRLFDRAVRTNSGLCLFFRARTRQMIFVPDRAFVSEAEAGRFLKFAQTSIDESANQPGSATAASS